MQCACIEFARNVCNLPLANTRECQKEGEEGDYVIDLMDNQKEVKEKGGTMRLGAYKCIITGKDTLAFKAYKSLEIEERHRHRYEFNKDYSELFNENGMRFTGTSPDGKLIEIIELKDHPWFVGVQFHPELKSRAVTGHPLFIAFIKAALEDKK